MNHEAGYAMVCCAYMRVDTGRAGSLGGQSWAILGTRAQITARSRLQATIKLYEAFCEALHVSTYIYMYTERVTAAKGDTMTRSNHSPLTAGSSVAERCRK